MLLNNADLFDMKLVKGMTHFNYKNIQFNFKLQIKLHGKKSMQTMRWVMFLFQELMAKYFSTKKKRFGM